MPWEFSSTDLCRKRRPSAFKPIVPTEPPQRPPEEAWRQLMNRIDRTAAHAKDVPEAELDALIDEATEYARHQAA